MAGVRYFTVSFDDGLEQDKRLIRLMKQYGIRGTFNLNSGLFGKRDHIARIGNIAFKEFPDGGRHFPYRMQEHFRIPEDEIRDVYADMEIAAHARLHENLTAIPVEQARESVRSDVARLSEICGQEVVGFAYPYGAVSSEVRDILRDAGIRYARGVRSSRSFTPDADLLEYHPTCWITEGGIERLLKNFVKAPCGEEDRVFCLWGHGYELDYGTGNCSWERIERIFSFVAEQESIVCATCGEAFGKFHNEEA